MNPFIVLVFLITTAFRESGAQRVPQLAIGIAPSNLSFAPSIERRRLRLPDSAASAAPRPMPFVLGGAGIGAFVGAMLAVAYNPCSDDPQPGFIFSSTDPATGALIGLAVGTAAGLLVWAVVKSTRAARAKTGNSPAQAHRYAESMLEVRSM